MSGPLERPGARHNTAGEARADPTRDDLTALAAGFVNCLRDDFVQVRRSDGSLLGVVPQFADNVEKLWTSKGQECPTMQGVVRGVLVPDEVDPRDIPGFVAREGARLVPLVRPDGSLNARVLPDTPETAPRQQRRRAARQRA